MKKFISYMMVLLMLLCLDKGFVRAENGGEDPEGSITVIFGLADSKRFMTGAAISVFKVADCTITDGEITYTMTEPYGECGVGADDLYAANVAYRLYSYTEQKGITGLSRTTDENGKVVFENLENGMYLVVQDSKVNPFSMAAPFMVAIPYAKDGVLTYQVDAAPKVTIEYLMEYGVKKVWNDDGQNRPSSVTVVLKKENAVYDTVVLSAENNWSHYWTSLPQSTDWSVEEINVPIGYAASYRLNGNTFIVENTPTQILIQTGQLWWPVPVLAAVGILLLILGYLGYRKNED